MSMVVAVLFGDELFYYAFSVEKTVTIKGAIPADVVVPGLNFSIYASWEGTEFRVVIDKNGTTENIAAALDTFAILDQERKIALFFSEEVRAAAIFPLDFEGEYDFGRSSRKISSGRMNDAVIDLPFIDRKSVV